MTFPNLHSCSFGQVCIFRGTGWVTYRGTLWLLGYVSYMIGGGRGCWAWTGRGHWDYWDY